MLLTVDDLRRRFPWLRTNDLKLGSFGGVNEGWTDAYALMQALRRKATDLGADLIANTVISLSLAKDRIVAVNLAGGDALVCGHVVNVAGANAATIAAARIDIPVRPRKRLVLVIGCRDPVVRPASRGPLTVDPSGVYFRSEGSYFLTGHAPEENEDRDAADMTAGHCYFQDRIWAALANRVPAFEAVRVVRAWAGHYAYNIFDQNALVGYHPNMET